MANGFSLRVQSAELIYSEVQITRYPCRCLADSESSEDLRGSRPCHIPVGSVYSKACVDLVLQATLASNKQLALVL